MEATTDKLVQDLQAVVGDAEELLKATATQTGEHISRIRARAEESVRAARVQLKNAGESAGLQAREAARQVDQQVRENPWAAVGVAAGIGLLIGVLLGRK
jgi:ElaB/YqjD/DUF883 family membrane-anchored ribosome-binding protein